ncbi:hypothetical protein OGAPHI_000596 [Ogataea philodendri]|uniref:Uncharacterized protein n=1 Tax=Ogataea philodendri TaxID=1378263 RepID=A0A9P8PG20_9ASCO|nr:uncharacterized protein OGAPHI_000596 [Ogataea philodendri]KAH3670885.1 hypothetical protein OGAPHI_000596 [Ogataea philodendri]
MLSGMAMFGFGMSSFDTVTNRSPCGSHWNALTTSFSSIFSTGISFSLKESSSRLVNVVFLDLVCLSTLQHRNFPALCQLILTSETLKRLTVLKTCLEGSWTTETRALWFTVSGVQYDRTVSGSSFLLVVASLTPAGANSKSAIPSTLYNFLSNRAKSSVVS